MKLLTATLSNQFTQASVATIKRHIESPRGLDTIAALRLLRRNVRDTDKRATHAVQWSIARQVLDMINRGEV